jgi:hypothetical protein
MVVPLGLGDAETDGHDVEKRSARDPILRDARKRSLLRMSSLFPGLILRSGPKDRVSKDGAGLLSKMLADME